jgi:drug/metabolite transporter (DMT)-like permease
MSAAALGLALLAAVAHSSWNLLIARTRETQIATAVALVSGVLVFAPIAALTWQLSSAALPYVVISSALELTYFVLLARAYRSAELSVIYPLARGSAPVIVLMIGGARSALQVGGVLAVALGTLLVRGLGTRGRWREVAAGLGVGVCIAAYTLVDQRGVRFANPTTYLEMVLVAPAVAYAAIALRGANRDVIRRAVRPEPVVAGVLMFMAYWLALAALQLAPAAAVSAVRETSVVIAVALANRVLRESVGYSRLVGAVLVATGVAAVALG